MLTVVKFVGGEMMRKAFMCSLCYRGILGGALYLDPQTITYKTQKITVDKKYKNLVLPLCDIKELTWKRVIFPVATFGMKNGDAYKFIIFNKSRFNKYYRQYRNSTEN